MNKTHRIWGTSVVSLLLAVGATACAAAAPSAASGSAQASASASAAAPADAVAGHTDPLAGQTPGQILAKVKTDMLGLTSVHSTAQLHDSGKNLGWDFYEVPGKACRGTLSSASEGSFGMIVKGDKAWLRLDASMLKQVGGSSAVAMFKDKYIVTSSTSGQFSSLTEMCDLTKTMSQYMDDATGVTRGGTTTADGAPAVKLTAPDGSVILISDTATPYLVSITKTGSSAGAIRFDGFNQPLDITPPPASQVASFPGM
ncbi:hypothetical protein [Streptacidiphilus neutrinimicus]|uniref:hypothetical protein n=1 Tax=Streptacidiphilus neutrinimicus TaxID=105420 RepID=UPI0005A82BCD|nr:hypothetical protein [Streptacidiphilus neutrinimicus]